jgi:hypothetical protein
VPGGVHARQATPAGAQGWDRDGASPWCMAEPGSAPWAAASTASAVGLRACVRAWFGQVRASVAAKESVPLPLETACAACPATARPGRRGHPRRRRRGKAQANRIEGAALSPDGRARVLGCTWAQGRRTRVVPCASANATMARRRGHERHGAACDGDKEQIN